MKVRFTQKKVNGDKYYRFKIDEDRQASRLSDKKYSRSQAGAVKVCMENGVRVGFDKNGEIVWSF